MKKNMLGAMIAAVALACAAHAEDVETVEVEMTGATRDAAVQAALQEAVAQVNGLVVRANRAERTTTEDKDGDLTSTQRGDDDVRKVSRGVVKSYRIINSGHNADGWTVRLSAQVMKYQSPLGMGKRSKLAVMPFRYGVSGFKIGGDGPDNVRPADMVAQDISGVITKTYTQSGTCNVLSRFGLTEMAQEEKLITEHSPVKEMVKVGQRLGADYLVVGYVRDLYVAAPVSKTSQLTGRTKVFIPRAYLRVAYRKLVVSTAEIAWMDEVNIELDPQALAGCGGQPDLAYETLLRQLGERVAVSIDAGLLPGVGAPVKIPSIAAP
jgi:curli biogenesis system outer membrane secretion channel CsgG